MQAGYFQPLTSQYRLLWMWWVILLSAQQVLFYENNLKLHWYTTAMVVILVLYFYFLVRQRRFFITDHQIHLTRDFRMKTLDLDLKYMTSVKLTQSTFSFVYIGKSYQYLVLGKSNTLLKQRLEEEKVLE